MDALIVPRGLSDDYYFFLKVSAQANDVEFIVDRRAPGDLRRQTQPVAAERRLGDRRGPLPPSWQTYGFITVERQDTPEQK
jgi:hypothetical protein